MKRMGTWAAIAGLAAGFAVHVTGCSLIGYAHGHAIDARTPTERNVQASEIVRVDPGTRVALQLTDSTWVRGIYRGSARMDEATYRAAYRTWRADAPHGDQFPELDERVELKPGGAGRFRGFVLGGVEIEGTRLGRRTIGGNGRLLSPGGRHVDMSEVREMELAGRVPLATLLRVDSAGTERRVPADRVIGVTVRTVRQAAVRGFVAGLIADALIVTVAAGFYEFTRHPLGSGCRDSSPPRGILSQLAPTDTAVVDSAAPPGWAFVDSSLVRAGPARLVTATTSAR